MDVFKKLPYIKSNINSKNAGGETPPSFLKIRRNVGNREENKYVEQQSNFIRQFSERC